MMQLTGDTNIPALPMTEAEVNHLRRLLAWMRCEWMLDENMQAGCVDALQMLTGSGYMTPEQAGDALVERANRINKCPAYVRQAVKMLTKALRDHECSSGVVDAPSVTRAAPVGEVTTFTAIASTANFTGRAP